MTFVTRIIRKNVKPNEEVDRMICNQLDKNYFNNLTEDEKASYRISYEPLENGLYNMVATYKKREWQHG